MKLTRRVVIFVLCALFVAAIAARVSTTDTTDSPYFKGASAMAYRHMLSVAEGRSLAAHDEKAGHPIGYTPARYRAAGAETVTGIAYRAVSVFSNIDGRPFTRRFVILFASLCVFTAYAAASRLWESREAGLLAAFVVTFLPTLADATNGQTFSHVVFAAFFASLHAAIALRALPQSSWMKPLLAALVALVLLWVWEPARYGLGAWVVAVALVPGIERRTRIRFVLAHTLVIIGATLLIPHLVAIRAAGAWTTAAVMAASVVAVLPGSMRRAWRAPVFLAAGCAALTVLAMPLRAGATEQFPTLEYVFTRVRWLFHRPDPSLLSDWMRHLWSADHAPLPPHQRVYLLLPILFCAIAWFMNPAVRAGNRARFIATLALLSIACVAAMVDRSIVPGAAMVMIIVVSGAVATAQWRRWVPSAAVALGAYTAVAGVVLEGRAADVASHVSRVAGGTRDPASFIWISFENTDRELVRFIATRTSVNESILAPEDLSGLLLAFSGRTSVQLPGTTSLAPSRMHVELARAMYRDEAWLYEVCRAGRIDYVLYSIDTMLDDGAYSLSSLAGVSTIDPRSIAARMHFDPESLRHFTLMYQNDHFRLFKVTEQPEPVFLTDHPLFYQRELFARDGHDLPHFRDHVVWLMVTYANGLNARARGDAEEARRMLDQCLRQAPRFTRARLALADALMDLGRYEEARDQIAGVIRYAPDNPAALYAAAYVQVQLKNTAAAKPYLDLLAQTGDPATIEKGRALRYYIDNNLPLKPGAPQ